jgi:hypothetical protein
MPQLCLVLPNLPLPKWLLLPCLQPEAMPSPKSLSNVTETASPRFASNASVAS